MFLACTVYKECQDIWRAIVVDEFQHTSAMQYCLLKILASHNHITIVGDEDQVHKFDIHIIILKPLVSYLFSLSFVFSYVMLVHLQFQWC